MEFRITDILVRSITIELSNDRCYKIDEEVDYYIDDEKVISSSLNVNTIYGLQPDTEYTVRVKAEGEAGHSHTIRTKKESTLLNVRDFGAKGDGKKLDTVYIQAAINACPPQGTVCFPEGIYHTGPLFLKSDMNIWIMKGSILLGDENRDDYPILPGMIFNTDEKDEYNLGTWEGNPLDAYASLLTGIDVKNTDIFGEGEIDGNAPASDWWMDPKIKRGAWRPRTIFLERCENIRLQGITVKNSPCWTIHPYYSDNVRLLSLNISNPYDSPNTDGVDPESCNDLKIIGTRISVGDDCIAIKSGKYYMALRHHKPSENMEIRNCLLQNGHGSVTIGSECAGGVRKVYISQCIFDGTDRGLRIKTRRGRGKRSVLENIEFENIIMKDVRMPFTVNMFYFCDPDGHSDNCQNKGELPVDDMTPEIRSVKASRITCSGVDVCVLCAYGLPEKKIGQLIFKNIDVTFKNEDERKKEIPLMMDDLEPMSGRGIYVRNVEELILDDIKIRSSEDTDIDSKNADRIQVKGVEFL